MSDCTSNGFIEIPLFDGNATLNVRSSPGQNKLNLHMR
jgi:hypothetical protein